MPVKSVGAVGENLQSSAVTSFSFAYQEIILYLFYL